MAYKREAGLSQRCMDLWYYINCSTHFHQKSLCCIPELTSRKNSKDLQTLPQNLNFRISDQLYISENIFKNSYNGKIINTTYPRNSKRRYSICCMHIISPNKLFEKKGDTTDKQKLSLSRWYKKNIRKILWANINAKFKGLCHSKSMLSLPPGGDKKWIG